MSLDGDTIAGLVPKLFAKDVDASREALASDTAKLQGDMAKLYMRANYQ